VPPTIDQAGTLRQLFVGLTCVNSCAPASHLALLRDLTKLPEILAELIPRHRIDQARVELPSSTMAGLLAVPPMFKVEIELVQCAQIWLRERVHP
jgi:hypothetical protein